MFFCPFKGDRAETLIPDLRQESAATSVFILRSFLNSLKICWFQLGLLTSLSSTAVDLLEIKRSTCDATDFSPERLLLLRSSERGEGRLGERRWGVYTVCVHVVTWHGNYFLSPAFLGLLNRNCRLRGNRKWPFAIHFCNRLVSTLCVFFSSLKKMADQQIINFLRLMTENMDNHCTWLYRFILLILYRHLCHIIQNYHYS